ncbi:MAG: Small-conductance mechanosensitive channel MscMJ [Candidatus Methanofastidiosum methylothiophilum]|uniref:Small-conductance mechanosensitive channel MscMJ n=1 Tax=Candidatus Methanofastidiosum methylothiophilum TaxID=1705564 RepID=A0A150IT40_9EURY|nr:MAG: Small-conductance mechanosensitive channel MscMJ [Candidatus Methanofastidiosum methylthiophilus]
MNLQDILEIFKPILSAISAKNVFPFVLAITFIILSILISKGLTIGLRKYFKEKMEKDRLGVLLKITYYSIIALTIILVLPIIGINTSSLLVAGGVTGIIIGFASQSIVGNLMSGFFLMAERPIKIGSQVEIDSVRGYVEDIGLMSTILRDYEGLYTRIPNEKVFTNNIKNYSANVARRIEYSIGIRFTDDAEKAINIVKELVDEHPYILKHPSPDVFVDNISDSSVILMMRAWAPISQWYETKKELLWQIKTNLEKEGIQIPYPQRVIWFANDKSLGKNNSN